MDFSVRPVFVGWVALLCQLPIQLFLTIWSGFFFGGMAKAAKWFPADSADPFILFGGLAFLICPAFFYFGKKWNYDQTEYKFFTDHLEYEEGFFTISKKQIRYEDIKEVTLNKGVLQQIYGLGTIYLATMATGAPSRTNVFGALGFGNTAASGIAVRDIAAPDEIYEKIRSIVGAHKN